MTDHAFNPKDSAERKACPVASGVVAYFPDALVLVSRLSRIGNDKHNPGLPLHWAKEKSGDEPDALMRHLIDHLRGEPPDADVEELGEHAHLTQVAWRALAMLQRACDAERASVVASVQVSRAREEHCDHGVRFDSNAAIGLRSLQIRALYPRFEGKCFNCGYEGIAYASQAHMIAGDW